MAKVDELVVEVQGDLRDINKKLSQVVDNTEKATSKMGGAFSVLDNSIGKAAIGLGAFSLAMDGAQKIAETLTGVLDRLGEKGALLRTSKQLGINVEKFQEFSFAARTVGVDTEVMADAIKDLNVKITDTAKNGGVLENALKQLGLEAKDLVDLSPDEQFEKFADAIQKADENIARLALDEVNDSMFELFNLVRGGSEALNSAAEEARELNQVFTEMELKRMEQVAIEADKIKAGFGGLLDEVLVELAPVMKNFLETTLNGLKAINKIFDDEDNAIKQVTDPDKWAEATEASKKFWAAQKEAAKPGSFGIGPLPGVTGGTTREDDERAAKENVAVTGQDLMKGMPWWMTEEGQSQADAFRELEIQKQEEFNRRITEIQENREDYEKRLWESGWKGKAQISQKYLKNISSLMNTESRKTFELGKVASIASATISMYESAQDAYKFGTKIGGPPTGAAFAATAIAAGLNNINNIRSTSFGSAGGGAASTGGAVGVSSVDGAQQVQEVVNVTNVDVSLGDDGIYSDTQIRALISAINDASDDNFNIRT